MKRTKIILLLVLLGALCCCIRPCEVPIRPSPSTEDKAQISKPSPSPEEGAEPSEPVSPPDQSEVADKPSEGVDLIYPCSSRDLLSSYKQKSKKDFEEVCKQYEERGFQLYSSFDVGGNLAKTYTKGTSLAHLYYHPVTEELNVVLSESAGGSLPPATSPEGEFKCTVTQLRQYPHGNGMGYVIRLKDGSFIIYDGGYATAADEILEILKEQSEEEPPLIRAWIITHFHNDHYTAFHEMAKRARASTAPFTLETVIASPLVKGYTALLNQFSQNVLSFPGARFVFAHTGMKFTFCNLTLEILYTPESLYKTAPDTEDFNNTSIVSRLRDENTSMLFTGDIALAGASLIQRLYGSALSSDMVQMSHHGLEDAPLSFYEKIRPKVLWYPCSTENYHSERNLELRRALESWSTTEEILIAGAGRYCRVWSP
ncbi:MAG: MBL fold metallo-hydrolase [Clostridia bacterium]|nr:MBL fold metallo-hydrolase [Clostridia bacterium]